MRFRATEAARAVCAALGTAGAICLAAGTVPEQLHAPGATTSGFIEDAGDVAGVRGLGQAEAAARGERVLADRLAAVMVDHQRDGDVSRRQRHVADHRIAPGISRGHGSFTFASSSS